MKQLIKRLLSIFNPSGKGEASKTSVSQQAKDVISVSEIFQRGNLSEEQVKQARLKLDAAMKKLGENHE
jgi:hypothetical protein